jgi:hypothetical protein
MLGHAHVDEVRQGGEGTGGEGSCDLGTTSAETSLSGSSTRMGSEEIGELKFKVTYTTSV